MARNRQLFARICSIFAAVLLLLSLAACGHIHKWQDATCARPKTCTGCGETQGEKTRHNVPEDGVCTVCKQKQDNVLTLEKKSRLYPPIMYGGVFLRMYISSEKNGTMFPGQYTIYAEDETVVASGDWGAIPLEPHVLIDRAEDTEYIPLQPGNYWVEFTFYSKLEYDEIAKTLVPLGDPVQATFNFIVK